MDFLSSPAGMAAIGGGVVLIVLLVLRARGNGGGAPRASASDSEMTRLAARGQHGKAAQLALQDNKLDLALEYYLRAQQPEQAASVAIRLGKIRQAAELYERAHNWEKAALFFDKADMADHANQIRRERLGQLRAGQADATAAPASRGRALEAEYRRAHALADGSAAQAMQHQGMARTAAEALLAEGEVRRAADLFRDAELDDEAIHLYVNVLGDPGQAAPILSRRGNHTRAAELYELAGDNERAASTWVAVAEEAQRPEIFLDRIERLSRDVAQGFLEQATRRRPMIDQDSVELHYRLAQLYAKRGDSGRALAIYQSVQQSVGGYREVERMIQDLRAGKDLREADPTAAEPEIDLEVDLAPASTPSGPFDEAQLRSLADQVAKAAAEQLRRAGNLELPRLTLGPGPTAIGVAGLESGAGLQIELLLDGAVKAARGGPSIETLRGFIGDRPCDLQNIEVYYRLALAHLAQGDWQAALADFDAVDEASPGYRDAWKRAEEIRGWEKALGKKLTQLGAAPGKDSGRYRLRGELGRGGMAVVYRADDSMLGREVALKFLSESLSGDPEMRELFQREAKAVAALNHPNIVTIHDVGVLEGRAFLCMEFVEGKSVETLMTEAPGLTIVESLRIIVQVLDALAYAHARKIIHRDIKPANMMRTPSGLVKLMDFGLAKSIADGTKQSVVAGTPMYMPPEQLRGAEVDHRADLFAIAVSLYELLTGHAPFDGMERNGPPPPPSTHVPAIPPVLEAIVMRGLELDPKRRPQSAAEMAAPLHSVLEAVATYAGGAVAPAKAAIGTAPTMVQASKATVAAGAATGKGTTVLPK
ncbi:MAG: protein kinase [Deltaproteobacteria bacterium]|nr:protein kinase [Deltaproteobacteria bacterium]